MIESHPDNEFDDLRLDIPFPSLKRHMDAYEEPPFASMTKAEHSHIPYLVLLYKYLQVNKANFLVVASLTVVVGLEVRARRPGSKELQGEGSVQGADHAGRSRQRGGRARSRGEL